MTKRPTVGNTPQWNVQVCKITRSTELWSNLRQTYYTRIKIIYLINITTKCISALTERSEYLGCWAIYDTLPNVALPNISVTECRIFCTVKLSQFAILNGESCHCLNIIANKSALKDYMCTDLCFSNNSFEREYCGNQSLSAYSVYSSFRMIIAWFYYGI